MALLLFLLLTSCQSNYSLDSFLGDPRLWDVEHESVKSIPEELVSRINTRIVYYDVVGRSVASLHQKMLEKTACNDQLPHYQRQDSSIACTIILFTPPLPKKTKSAESAVFDPVAHCNERSLSVDLQITIYLPRWQDRSDARDEIQEAWSFFNKAIARHEDGHMNIAIKEFIDYQQRLAWALNNYLWSDDQRCQQRKKIYLHAWDELLQNTRKRTETYDERTAHGVRNGTSFY